MVGSDMDGDRSGASVRRRSFAKRQQQMGGAGAGCSSSAALAFNGEEGDACVLGRCENEKASQLRLKSGQCEAGTVEGETAAITTPSSTCRKRVRLSGKKPAEDCNAVDPALVPRKSRSATKKISRQSALPLLPDLKMRKKHCNIPNGTDVSCLNDGARVDHTLLFDSITEDMKEVVEALFVLSGTVPMSLEAEDKESKIFLQDISSGNALSPSAKKVPNDVNISLLHTSLEAEGLHFLTEKKVEHTVFQKVATDSGYKSSKPDLNGEPYSCKATPSNNSVKPNSTLSTDAVMVLTSLEVSHQNFENGEVRPAEYDPPATIHVDKPDNNQLSLGSRKPAKMYQHEVQMLEQNNTGNTEKIASMLQGGLSDASCGQLAMLSSSQSAICPGLDAGTLKPSFKCSTPGTKKLAPWPLSATSSQKKCAIHIAISHLIRDYRGKGMEKQHILLSPKDAIKSEEKSKLGTEATQQKQHSSDFSLLPTASGACESALFGNDTKQSTQIHSSYPHPQVPQRGGFPFHFTHGSQYAEKLSAAAKPQINLQVHPYFGNPFYVQQSGLASNTKLQQYLYQMWQAQVTRCSSSMGGGVLQNGQLHDPSSFFWTSAQSPFSISVGGVQGMTNRQPNAQEQLQLASTPHLPSRASPSIRWPA